MKKIVLVLALACLFQVFGGFKPVVQNACAQQMDARVSYFYDALLPYGEWMWNSRFGWCWTPYNVSVDWQPYTDGYWVETDYGLAWESDYPWGWACFHYGRWFFDDNYGWLWFPDTVWAPSWVAWRYGGDWVGWAPLPPEARWDNNSGLIFSDRDADDFIPFFAFNFVGRREFFGHHTLHRMRDPARNVTIMVLTSRASNTLRRSGNYIINQVPFENDVITAAGRPIERLKVTTSRDVSSHGVNGKEMRVYRPEMDQKTAVAESTTRTKREVTGRVSSLQVPKTPVQVERQAPVRQEVAPAATGQQVTPRRQAQQVPAEVTARQQADAQALDQLHNERRKALVQEQAQELKNVPEGPVKKQVIEQHKAETGALQQQAVIEDKVVKKWQQREIETIAAPQAASPVVPGAKFKIKVKKDISEKP